MVRTASDSGGGRFVFAFAVLGLAWRTFGFAVAVFGSALAFCFARSVCQGVPGDGFAGRVVIGIGSSGRPGDGVLGVALMSTLPSSENGNNGNSGRGRWAVLEELELLGPDLLAWLCAHVSMILLISP